MKFYAIRHMPTGRLLTSTLEVREGGSDQPAFTFERLYYSESGDVPFLTSDVQVARRIIDIPDGYGVCHNYTSTDLEVVEMVLTLK